MKNWFRFSLLAMQIVTLLVFTQSLKAQPLRKATFELKNEVIVQVPDGAKRVRVWTALPQDESGAANQEPQDRGPVSLPGGA
jgi:hypothetical protein